MSESECDYDKESKKTVRESGRERERKEIKNRPEETEKKEYREIGREGDIKRGREKQVGDGSKNVLKEE